MGRADTPLFFQKYLKINNHFFTITIITLVISAQKAYCFCHVKTQDIFLFSLIFSSFSIIFANGRVLGA